MRKCGLLFLVIFFLTYGYQGVKTVYEYMNDVLKVKTSGKLSDIASQNLSVPLETPDSGVIRQIRRVQRDGDHLFMFADQRLLQFDISGKFIRQFSLSSNNDEDVYFADYTLDTDRHQVIAIDSNRYFLRYDYDGNLLASTQMLQPFHKMTALAYHNRSIWITAESLEKQDENYYILHNLYRFNANMKELSNQRLNPADVGREKLFDSYLVDELLADEYGVYAFTSPFDMEYLLHDTLHIILRQDLPILFNDDHFCHACIYPIRKGKRFQISSCYQSIDNPFTFCYDRIEHIAYRLSKGFKDDFYHTGYITEFQPMDIYNQSYCYVKYGHYLSDAMQNDNPALFIVTLKS